jgi:multidrug efflux pump subunit AcrA (membrane-fusion protein)
MRFSPRIVALETLLLVSSTALLAQGQPPAVPVRYTEALNHQVRRTVRLTGSVESRRTSIVAAEVEGLVVALVAREGDRVQKGQGSYRRPRRARSWRAPA